jgi:hypothetical protein
LNKKRTFQPEGIACYRQNYGKVWQNHCACACILLCTCTVLWEKREARGEAEIDTNQIVKGFTAKLSNLNIILKTQ